MVFVFFVFYLYLFNVPNSIHFDYLATLWMVLNWYPGVVKSLRLKEILNLNCDKWTNVGESMWKGSRRLKWRLPLSAFHKAWLLTILSVDLILFNLFVSLQPFTRPFLMEHQNEDFFFLSVSPPPISPSVASSPSCLYFILSPSLSLCYHKVLV